MTISLGLWKFDSSVCMYVPTYTPHMNAHSQNSHSKAERRLEVETNEGVWWWLLDLKIDE